MTAIHELTEKLREIFQIDRSDLDFGIYRILNTRHKAINDYLQKELPAAVKSAFGDSANAQSVQWQQELSDLEKTLNDAGVALDSSSKYKALKDKIKDVQSHNISGENAVYNHLLTFFSRYYDEGDFISLRRYKGDTYAIPYAGEEVLLHWANKDQYYTKSGENFSNYRIKLDDGREVFFRLVAADTAKDNRKDGKVTRVFALIEAREIEREDDAGEIVSETLLPIVESKDGKTLTLHFEYRVVNKKEKQAAYTATAIEAIHNSKVVEANWAEAIFAGAPTEKKPERTLLEKHLNDYTQKNTADYFIHKDLGGFLRRELDFYIKNEVMQLDNIAQADSFERLERDLRLIQTLRKIADDIITFLAQLENFQKKLWLKKKFVAGVSYLITLDKIPEKFWQAISGNVKQLQQWQNLYKINKLSTPPSLIILL